MSQNIPRIVFHIFPLVFLIFSLFFELPRLREAPGPLPNCRSHFSASNRGIESFWIPQNTSFMTKQCPKTFHEVFPLVFPIFSLFFELLRLRDQSQIVDLIFAVRTVASRASETSKVPHSWQNNVQNVSQTNMQNPDIKKKWWLYLWNSPGGGKELLKFSQSTILLSLNTTYTRIPFLRPVNQMY